MNIQGIDHIGIAVYDMEKALPFYRTVLGLEWLGCETVAAEKVKIAFLRLGSIKIELLEPTDDSSPLRRFLDKKGEGLHHIAVRVRDIDAGIRHIQKHDIPMVHDHPVTGSGGHAIAFLHPKAAHGVLWELYQSEGET